MPKLLTQYLIISLLIGMWGCTPAQRLARLQRKHPDLFRIDTVTIIDTLRLPGDKADTSFLFSTTRDTVVIERGRLTMKYYYSKDTVFLQGECKDSVIVRELTTACPPVPNQENKILPDWLVNLLPWLMLACLAWWYIRRALRPP